MDLSMPGGRFPGIELRPEPICDSHLSLILCWCLDQRCLDQQGFSLDPSMEYTLSRIFIHIYAYLMYTYAYLLILQASIKDTTKGGGPPKAARPPLWGLPSAAPFMEA